MFSAFYGEYNVGFWKMQIIAFCLLLQQNYSIATNWRANLEQIKVFTVLKNMSRVSSQKSNCFTIWPSRNCVQLTEHDSASGFPCSLTPSLPYTCLLLSLSYPFGPEMSLSLILLNGTLASGRLRCHWHCVQTNSECMALV